MIPYDSIVTLMTDALGRILSWCHVVSIECMSDVYSEFCRADEFQTGMSFLWDTVVAPKQSFNIEIQAKSQARSRCIQDRYVEYM